MSPQQLQEERKIIGAELQKLRIEKKLTRKDLAGLSGLSRNTIYRMETGLTAVTTDCIIIYKHTLQNHASC